MYQNEFFNMNRSKSVNDRPHPFPLPQERETPWAVVDNSKGRSTNSALSRQEQRRMVLLLLGEKAGMRADVHQTVSESFTFRTSMREILVRRIPQVERLS